MTRRRRRSRGSPLGPIALVLLALVVLAVAFARTGALPIEPVDLANGQVYVSRAVDGDTIVVQAGGGEYRIRYIGIDTPETVAPGRPVEHFGKEAWERNKALVEGKVVTLEKDVSETDRYGRLLRYVYVDGVMVNAVLVEEGYARSSSYPPDVRHQELFTRLEREARNARRGLWGQ